MVNWNDPAERAALIERVGVAEYNRLHPAHLSDSIVGVVNGRPIRTTHSARFGKLYQVDGGSAFHSMQEAIRHANGLPRPREEPPMGADDQGIIHTYTKDEARQLAGWSALRRFNPDRIDVFRHGKLYATLVKTPWDKWKIKGEDTYAKTADDLLARLRRREGDN